jgi:hypothetical protein
MNCPEMNCHGTKKNEMKFRSAFLWIFFFPEEKEKFSPPTEHFLLFRFSLNEGEMIDVHLPKKKFSSFYKPFFVFDRF